MIPYGYRFRIGADMLSALLTPPTTEHTIQTFEGSVQRAALIPGEPPMPRPFFDRLRSYFQDVGKVLRGQANSASIFPNPTDVGMSRERVYAEFLRQHLPSSCNVCFGGFLFDQEGNESSQVDVIITNDSSLRFDLHNPEGTGKSFGCIDGCVGVVCLKSNLTTAELRDALLNLASIPNKQSMERRTNPLVRLGNYEDWPFKIIYSPQGVQLETILSELNGFYQQQPGVPLHKRPNLIHVAGQYYIVRAAGNAQTRDGTKIPENSFYGQADPTDVVALYWAVTNIQKVAMGSKHVLYDYRAMLDKIPF